MEVYKGPHPSEVSHHERAVARKEVATRPMSHCEAHDILGDTRVVAWRGHEVFEVFYDRVRTSSVDDVHYRRQSVFKGVRQLGYQEAVIVRRMLAKTLWPLDVANLWHGR